MTVLEFLKTLNFDFSKGKIYYSESPESAYCPGWDNGLPAKLIDEDHPILREEFNTSFGSPQHPRIVAYDETAVYFPCQYDGSTWMEKVYLSPEKYITGEAQTPYPGG